jgi:hypothetical protein
MFLRRFEFHYFIENSGLVGHARKFRRKRRPEDRRRFAPVFGAET